MSERCPSTFGREGSEHCFITITRSSTLPTPHRMCSKCGVRVLLPTTPPKMEQEGL